MTKCEARRIALRCCNSTAQRGLVREMLRGVVRSRYRRGRRVYYPQNTMGTDGVLGLAYSNLVVRLQYAGLTVVEDWGPYGRPVWGSGLPVSTTLAWPTDGR